MKLLLDVVFAVGVIAMCVCLWRHDARIHEQVSDIIKHDAITQELNDSANGTIVNLWVENARLRAISPSLRVP